MVNEISQKHSDSGNSDVVRAGVDFFESLGHAAFVQPVESVAQIFDEIQGKPLHLNKQDANASGGLDGFASEAGSMIGSALPFVASAVLLHRYVPFAAESKLMSFGTGAALGFGYSGLFSPVYGNTNNFWEAKLHNAAVSGLTVGTMSLFMRSPIATDSTFSNIASRGFAGLKAGFAGGIVNAESDALLSGHPLASPDKLMETGLTYGLTGAVLGGVGGAMAKADATSEDSNNADVARTTDVKPGLASQLAAGKSSFDGQVEKMPPTIGRDDEDGSIVILDSGRTASFKDGAWQPGVQFSKGRILDFSQVTDPNEVSLLMQAAADALRKSAEKP